MTKRSTTQRLAADEEFLISASPDTESLVEGLEHFKALELRQDTARYVERMCADLVVMATQVELNFLAYLLDMARIEAADRTKDEKLNQKTIHVS